MPTRQLTYETDLPPLTAKEAKAQPALAEWLKQLNLAIRKRERQTSDALATFALPVPVSQGALPPTSGHFTAGSIRLIPNPTAGGFIGWVCITTGTPGTWKAWGPIAL